MIVPWQRTGFQPRIRYPGRSQPKDTHDTVHLRTRIFVDAGHWGSANYWWADRTDADSTKTDFVVISGRRVLLCSWLPASDAELSSDQHYQEEKPPLDALLNRRHRGFIVDEIWAWSNITPDDRAIVVIPDLHLSLFRGQATDNFVHSVDGQRTSLEEELANLLDACAGAGAEVWQVGDAYESWEAQAVLLGDLAELRQWQRLIESEVPSRPAQAYARALRKVIQNEVMQDGQSELGSLERPSSGAFAELRYLEWVRDRALPFTVYEDPRQTARRRQVLEAADKEQDSIIIPRNPKRTLYEAMLGVEGSGLTGARDEPWSAARIKGEGIEVLKQASLREAIEKQYPLIFPKGRRRWEWIQGNHDNMLKTDLARFGIKEPIAVAGDLPEERIEHTHEGRVTVVAEHGHAYDKYNNNQDFAKEGLGLEKTANYVLARGLSGWTGGEMGPFSGAVDRWAADLFYNMRPSQKARAAILFRDYPTAKVVVMGHTHSALLEDFDSAARIMVVGSP